MDFTKEMQLNDNDKVNELCGCVASQLTYSRRTDRTRHQKQCDYRLFIETRVRKLIIETFPADKAQHAAASIGIEL
jgi:hypothetical protein